MVCYDIANDKRLRRIAKICQSYGNRIQFSVFECSLDDMLLASLKSECLEVIHHYDDQILFVDLGPDDENTPFTIQCIGSPYMEKSRITII